MYYFHFIIMSRNYFNKFNQKTSSQLMVIELKNLNLQSKSLRKG